MWSCEIPSPDRFSSQVSGYTQGPKKAAQSKTSLGMADHKQYQCPPLGGWISSPPVVSAGEVTEMCSGGLQQTELCAMTCLKDLGHR